MGWLSAITNMLPMAVDFADGWQERRLEKRKMKHEAEVMRIQSSATERGGSWKDEAVLIVVAYPLITVFIPGLREHTLESLEYLGQLPEWLIWSWLTIVAAVYGVTTLLEKIKIR